MVAGLTLEQTQFYRFCQRFAEMVDEWLDPAMRECVIWLNGELAGLELSLTTAELPRAGSSGVRRFHNPLFDGWFCTLNQHGRERYTEAAAGTAGQR